MIKLKRGIAINMLAWWIIALIVLGIFLITIFVLTGKGTGAINFIKNTFRF